MPVASGIPLFHPRNPLKGPSQEGSLKFGHPLNIKKYHCSLDHGLVGGFNMFQHVSTCFNMFQTFLVFSTIRGMVEMTTVLFCESKLPTNEHTKSY